MDNKIHDIFDLAFKRLMTLSSKSVINMINGIFDTEYPLDSKITYHWTENVDADLQKTLADAILTINDIHSYHMEAQMYVNHNIIFRIFDYGYRSAHQSSGDTAEQSELIFPEPRIIYLCNVKNIPDEYFLTINFGSQGKFIYKVKTLRLMEMTIEELIARKMIILIPFYLLKLREQLKKSRSIQDIEALKNLISNDIIGNIKKNEAAGNISPEDASKLIEIVVKLYKHLYSGYREMDEGGVNAMVDEYFFLESDKKDYLHKKAMEEKENEILALKLLLQKVPIEDICRQTGLTQDHITRLSGDSL